MQTALQLRALPLALNPRRHVVHGTDVVRAAPLRVEQRDERDLAELLARARRHDLLPYLPRTRSRRAVVACQRALEHVRRNDIFQRASDDVLVRYAEELAERRIHGGHSIVARPFDMHVEDRVRNRVENHRTQVLAQPDRLLHPAALEIVHARVIAQNRDGHQVRGDLNPALFLDRRPARLAVIHGERGQYIAVGGENGCGPTGTQPVRKCEIAVLAPGRMGRNVVDDDRQAGESGGAAGADFRSDREAFDAADELRRQSLPRSMRKPAIGGDQHDRAQHLGRLRFDQRDDLLQNLLQRQPERDRFEHRLLARSEGVAQPGSLV